MSTIALVPARSSSKGIPGKNLRMLGDHTLIGHAIRCAYRAGIDASDVWLTTNYSPPAIVAFHWINRHAELCADDTPMIAVVQHALEQIPGQPNDIIVLLQPTQPFRKPEHVKAAIALLQASGADSVVSVVPLPLTHHPDVALFIYDKTSPRLGLVMLDKPDGHIETPWDFSRLPTRRQALEPVYIRDGTVYAFRRSTVAQHGNLYGQYVRPLLIDPADSCELDTEADWLEVERRWKERHGG